MDRKKTLPTFIEIESVIRPGGRRPPLTKAPEKRMKIKSDGKGSPASRGSVKSK